MSHAKAMLGHQKLDLLGKPQQPNEVGYRGAIFSSPLADIFVTQAVFAGEAVKRMGDFNRVQVFALNILNEGDFQQALICKILYDYRNFRETGQAGGSPAASRRRRTGTIHFPSNHERLDNAVRFIDWASSLSRSINKDCSGLDRIGLDRIDGKLLNCGRWLLGSGRLLLHTPGGVCCRPGNRADKPLPSALR